MPFDSDVALLGTGLAPLIAAREFLAEGKSVLLLNPELDYFREDSELPLDPIWPLAENSLTPERLSRSLPERALAEMRPGFPGAVELWPEPSGGGAGEGFHDDSAPHVRSRSRLWIQSSDHLTRTLRSKEWELIEDMYVASADAGFKPQLLEGLSAIRRFPGSAESAGKKALLQSLCGILMPKLCEVDVDRYRNGLLEFIRERVSPSRILCGASQIDLIPGGIRFHYDGAPHTARLSQGLRVFWTPRLTYWVRQQLRRFEGQDAIEPRGVRLWEEWSLISRDALDPSIVGIFEDMTVWAEAEGAPTSLNTLNRLSVLKAGTLIEPDAFNPGNARDWALTWASGESFEALNRLCREFLSWEKFTVRSFKPRAVFEWEPGIPAVFRLGPSATVVGQCDGPLVDVVSVARAVAGAAPSAPHGVSL